MKIGLLVSLGLFALARGLRSEEIGLQKMRREEVEQLLPRLSSIRRRVRAVVDGEYGLVMRRLVANPLLARKIRLHGTKLKLAVMFSEQIGQCIETFLRNHRVIDESKCECWHARVRGFVELIRREADSDSAVVS